MKAFVQLETAECIEPMSMLMSMCAVTNVTHMMSKHSYEFNTFC